MANRHDFQIVQATAPAPGAIAIIQLIGPTNADVMHELTGVDAWPIGKMRLVDLGGVDEGLAVRVQHDVALLMPHSGPRVLQRLMRVLTGLGGRITTEPQCDPTHLYPEAHDQYEALALDAVARASSPLAVPALLEQPARWRSRSETSATPDQATLERSNTLQRLIEPPTVVLVGEPNVGKSTLSNALSGRPLSISADVAGTTRDYVVGRVNLDGLVVDWHDTPGLGSAADAIELKAIDLASRLIDRADLLIAMRDEEHPWPVTERAADFFVLNKIDEREENRNQNSGRTPEQAFRISARHGHGIADLAHRIKELLVPPALIAHPGLWVFDRRLTD